jgi:tripeptidyl-peptidase-1
VDANTKYIKNEIALHSKRAIPHTLVISIHQNNIELLKRELYERATPGHPQYQQWFSREEIGEKVENKKGTQSVFQWLRSHNVPLIDSSPYGEYIYATAPLSHWENILNTTFFKWRRMEDANEVYRCESFHLPHFVKKHISTIFHTTDLPPMVFHSPHFQEVNVHSASRRLPGAVGYIWPQYLYDLYEIVRNADTNDWNISQAIFSTNNGQYSADDVLQFQKTFGVSQTGVDYINRPPINCKTNLGVCFEGNLDLQYIMAMAENIKTYFWYEYNYNDPFVNFIINVVNNPSPPQVLSFSWVCFESSMGANELKHFEIEAMKAVAQGITIVAGTGDDGVSGYGNNRCDWNSSSSNVRWTTNTTWNGVGYFPMYPATCPYVVAVGGTMGPNFGTSEVAAQSPLSPFTSGGGFSTYYSRPPYQYNVVNQYLEVGPVPPPGFNPLGRAYPDISFIGVFFAVCNGGGFYATSGTSCTSPLAGGLFNLINIERKKRGMTSIGFVHPTLYANAHLFNDIVFGNNTCRGGGTDAICCSHAGFQCASGWDPVTGLGSIQYPALLSMFLNAPTVTPTLAPTTLAPTVTPTFAPTVCKCSC